jgi:hypothetical protein
MNYRLNLTTSCEKCNLSKGGKHPGKFVSREKLDDIQFTSLCAELVNGSFLSDGQPCTGIPEYLSNCLYTFSVTRLTPQDLEKSGCLDCVFIEDRIFRLLGYTTENSDLFSDGGW